MTNPNDDRMQRRHGFLRKLLGEQKCAFSSAFCAAAVFAISSLSGCSSPEDEQSLEEWTPTISETSSVSTWNPDTQVSGDGNFISAPSQLPAGCLADTELGTKVSVMADTEVVMFGPALKLESAQDVFAIKIDGPSFDATVAVFRAADSNGQEEFFALNEPARLHWPEMKKADGDLSVTRCAKGD